MEDSRISSDPKRRCPAMVEAGIDDPESQEGKDFCTKKCPYDKCVVYEVGRGAATLRMDERIARAREMDSEGYSIEDIAKELKVHTRTVRRYLAG